MIKVAILTVSDRCSRGERKDLSGPLIRSIIERLPAEITEYDIVPDEIEDIEQKLIAYADVLNVNLVFTTGGTGFSVRDITPEVTLKVIEREIPGIPEIMRAEGIKKTKTAMLSRGRAGIRGNTLIINLPGSVKAVEESLSVIYDIIPHALDMLKGKNHPNNEKD